jgi:hypothetical protein
LFLVRWAVTWSEHGEGVVEEVTTYVYAPEFAKKGSF